MLYLEVHTKKLWVGPDRHFLGGAHVLLALVAVPLIHFGEHLRHAEGLDAAQDAKVGARGSGTVRRRDSDVFSMFFHLTGGSR